MANKSLRTRFRAVTRRARAAIGTDDAAASFAIMQVVADRAARKGIVHRRTVARLKSRIVAATKKDALNPAPQKAAAKPAAAKAAPAAKPEAEAKAPEAAPAAKAEAPAEDKSE